MRRKKSCVSTPRKRKSFGKVFLEKWIRVMVVCGLAGILCLAAFTAYMKQVQRDGFYHQENNRINNIKDMKGEELSNFAQRQRFLGAAEVESGGIASLVYETDTKELLAGCEEQIFLIHRKTEESPTKIYSYPTEQIPGWEQYRSQLTAARKSGKIYFEDVEMPYFYVSGDEMIPGAFDITATAIDVIDYQMANDGYVPEKTMTYSVDEPKDIPASYEKQRIKQEDFLQPVLCGYNTTNPRMVTHPCVNTSYEIMRDNYQDIQKMGTEESRLTDTVFTVTMVSYRSQELRDGRNVTLLSCMHYDLLEVWGRIIAIITVAVLLVGSLLAFVLAKISYAGQKAKSAMEDYRRNLMNTMAHDLKSPLMSISGYAENLEAAMVPDKQTYYAGKIQENVQYINRMVESVLELSKVEQGGMHLNKETVDVRALFDEVQKRYETQLEEKNLKVTVEGAAARKMDRGLMLQALDNLLGNAVKYAAPGSEVQVVLDDKGLKMTNSCDTDLSDVVDKLCDPFVVGRESRSGKTGNGVGLAIVKNICELHGYRLQVTYENGQFGVGISFK